MKKNVIPMLVLVFLFASCLITPLPVSAAPTTIVVPDDYSTISAAVSHASNGDTILIRDGTYTEQTLEINKSLTITSEHVNGAKINLHPPQHPEEFYGGTIMVYDYPIRLYADGIKLSGCSITSDGGDISANGNHIQILNNTIGNKKWGISVYTTGNETQITGNTVTNIIATGSNNTVKENHAAALSIKGSFNLIINNDAGSMSLIGSRNLVDNNSFIGNSGVGIYLIDADYNVITNNVEAGSNVGIAFGYGNPYGGSYNILAGNTIENAVLWGILLGNGSNNVFYGNRIANNAGYGLALGGNGVKAENNLFFHNTFANNTPNFGANWDITGSNSFDNGAEGNYWDDYLTKYPDAAEISNSGVGNTPYIVYADNKDNYPLMNEPAVSANLPALPNPWSQLSLITPEPEPSQTATSQSATSPSPTPTSEAFPTVPVAAVSAVSVGVVSGGLLVYFKKRNHKS